MNTSMSSSAQNKEREKKKGGEHNDNHVNNSGLYSGSLLFRLKSIIITTFSCYDAGQAAEYIVKWIGSGVSTIV